MPPLELHAICILTLFIKPINNSKNNFVCNEKKKLPLHGGGKSLRSFIHIDDVSSSIYGIIKKGKIGTTYHISTDQFISISKLVEMILKKMSLKKKFIKISKDRLGKDHSYKLSTKLIKKQIKWKPEIK